MTRDQIKELAREMGVLFVPQDNSPLVRIVQKAVELERERICAAIKAEDDHCADGGYMLDSDDCIAVARGEWKRPDWNVGGAA